MALIGVLLVGGCGSCRSKPALFLITNVRVFDGRSMRAGPMDVLVVGERIAAVQAHVWVPAGAQVIDGAGKTVLPGLIDSHVHVHSEEALRQMAVFGVTTALDMMDPPMLGRWLKRRASWQAGLADLRFAGNAATVPGGHGTEYGYSVPTLSLPEEAGAFVDRRIAEGSDYLKIISDDCAAYGFSRPSLSKATIEALVKAAHAKGKLAVAHIGSLQEARDAIDVGADGLAHTFEDALPDPAFGAFVAAHHAFVIPTLAVSMSATGTSSGRELVQDAALRPFLSPEDVTNLGRAFSRLPNAKTQYAYAESSVRALKAAHVPILAGTDAPNEGTAYGVSLHGEMELLVRAGLSPTEALGAATAAPAASFHLDDRGRIAAGLRADLVLVDGDPSQDIRATRRIDHVWIRGQATNRAAYLAELIGQ